MAGSKIAQGGAMQSNGKAKSFRVFDILCEASIGSGSLTSSGFFLRRSLRIFLKQANKLPVLSGLNT